MPAVCHEAATGTGCGRRFLSKTAVTLWTRTDRGSGAKNMNEEEKGKKGEKVWCAAYFGIIRAAVRQNFSVFVVPSRRLPSVACLSTFFGL